MHDPYRHFAGNIVRAVWKVKSHAVPQSKMPFILFCCVLISIPVATAIAFGDDAINDWVNAFVKPDSDVDVCDVVKALFVNATDTTLDGLRHHPNDRVAIYAAWEYVLRKIERSKPSHPGTDERRLGDEVTGWWTGFIEGRFKTSVPVKWTAALKSATHLNNRTFVVPVESFWKPSLLSEPVTPVQVTHAKANQGAVIRGVRNNISIAVTNETINQAMEAAKIGSFDAVNVEANEEIVIVVLSNKGDLAVIGIHAKTGKVLWISRVATMKGGMSGMWSHSFECVIERDRVFLFGVFNAWCYVYSLNIATGEVEMNFDSTGV